MKKMKPKMKNMTHACGHSRKAGLKYCNRVDLRGQSATQPKTLNPKFEVLKDKLQGWEGLGCDLRAEQFLRKEKKKSH
jgi:hypothetical protein